MIFIDPPYWPAHGTVFSHVISNTSLAELHAFAAANKIAERAFDLDHYDVPQRRYRQLVAAGAVPISGKELARTLVASGLRIKAKYRVKSVSSVLALRWDALLPGQPGLGGHLLERWSEPHRHYHGATHLLAVLEALDALTERAAPQEVALAAWFHDAIYRGDAHDEEASAQLARSCLAGILTPVQVAEVARLVALTATHDPAAHDVAGQLLCDADLAILGSGPAEYSRYVEEVRKDYAHIPDGDFAKGRAAVVRQLLTLDPLFGTDRGRKLWAAQAHMNLGAELLGLDGEPATPGHVL